MKDCCEKKRGRSVKASAGKNKVTRDAENKPVAHDGGLIAREINRMLENMVFSLLPIGSFFFSLGCLSIAPDVATRRAEAGIGMHSDIKRLKDGVCRSPIPRHRIVLLKANV